MADGHRYMQQSFSTPLPAQFASNNNNNIASGLLLNSLLNQFITDPSAAQQAATQQANPAHGPAIQNNRGMYGQNHPQGHNPRLNGAAPGRQPNMPMFYNHVPQQGHPHQGHNAHHQVLQAGHTGHGARNDLMSHSTFSSGIMANASPYTNNLQNGHSVAARGGPAEQPPNEHWQKQLRLKEESDRAHAAMTEQHQPHYYARLKAPENKGIGGGLNAGANASGEEEEIRRRPYQVEKKNKRQDWHNMDMSGQGLRVLSQPLFSYEFLVELYIASNRLTFLPADIGRLRHLKILEASNNLLSELPPEIGMCTSLEKLLLFDNQIRGLPYELGSLYKLDILGIEGNPLEPTYRDEIVERGTKSLINQLLESAPVPMPPSPRKPIVIQEDVSPSLERIKVMTWNILCDKFATTNMYGYTPTGALSWEYRKERILQEIRDRDVDMLCLQEIATDVFRDFFSPELAQNDYKGVHWPRPKAKTMNERDAASVDGCAIFYKGSKWILLDKQLIDYANIAINRPDMKNQHDIFNRVMPKDNIGIICFFESRRTGARVIVANTHLAWEPTLADVKLVQTAILMENITKYAEKYVRWQPLKDKRGIQIPQSVSVESDVPKPEMPEPGPSQEYRSNTDIPLLVCGDYNSTQESSVYELLSMGRVTPEHSDFGTHQYGNFTRDGVAHPFSMRSAYVHLNGTPDELSFTNYVPGFQEVIDYIWYSTNTLEVVELLGPPDPNHLKRVPGFPNYHFPADHIQIMAEFVIKARKGEKVKALQQGGSSGSGSKQEGQDGGNGGGSGQA